MKIKRPLNPKIFSEIFGAYAVIGAFLYTGYTALMGSLMKVDYGPLTSVVLFAGFAFLSVGIFLLLITTHYYSWEAASTIASRLGARVPTWKKYIRSTLFVIFMSVINAVVFIFFIIVLVTPEIPAPRITVE